MRTWLTFIAALALSAPTPPAPTGIIRGRVDLAHVPPPVERRPPVGSLGGLHPASPIERRQTVVYLESAPRGAFETVERRARIDQRNETFVPRVLAITTGTTVDFPNSDRTYHNVFSISKTKRFDLGRYAAGRSRSVKFDQPGIVRVFCDIHSHMNAFILVFGHQFYAVTDPATGAYRLNDVPPGSYVVAVWHESLGAASQPVTVPPDGGSVELNFTLDRR
jgi:plastocyanin